MEEKMVFKQVQYLDKIIKAMKCDLFIIYPNRIVGTDEFFTTLSISYCATGVNDKYEMNKAIWDTMMSDVVNLANLDRLDFNKVISKLYCIRRVGLNPIDLLEQRTLSLHKKEIIRIDDARADQEFNNLLSMKKGDGMKFYRINVAHLFSMFAGLVKVTKSDKVSLNIYDIIEQDGSSPFFLTEYFIKKGSINIVKYFKYRKL